MKLMQSVSRGRYVPTPLPSPSPSLVSRYDSNSGGEREIQRTMLELLNQLDGFDARGDVKVSECADGCHPHPQLYLHLHLTLGHYGDKSY